MPKVLEKNNKIRLLIVGDGPLFSQLKNLAIKLNLIKNIIFAGKVEYKLLPFYYAAADIFVHPPYGFEAFGKVIIEAMACGKPIISTYCGGPEEIIDNYLNGILIEPNNPDKLADVIIQLIQDDQLIKKLIKNALKKVDTTFSWKIISKKYIKFLNNFI